VPAVLAAATGSNWNAGGSILTFYFPVGLFVVTAAILWLQFTRPHTTPGRRPFALARASADGPATVGGAADTGSAQAEPAASSPRVSGAGQDGLDGSGAGADHGPPAAGT
jgi:hypothetical protein